MSPGLFLFLLLMTAVGLSAAMSGAWLAWRSTGNSGWVDTVWTFGLAAVGIAGSLLAPDTADAAFWRPLLVSALVAVWAMRLGSHIALRTRRITDDPRYASLQKEWGKDAAWQMFVLLQKQALVSVPLALAIVLAAWNPAPGLRLQDIFGVVVLIVGIGGEALADNQLRRFGRDSANKGKVCEVGFWRWSRHPNYFFEWFGWLAYPLIAIDLAGTYAWGWLAFGGPLCIFWLLRYISGVPPLEEHMIETRGDAYKEYQRRTSVFFPLPPKKGAML
ncbi:DUF1295 domain-containing protein [uncultured Nitratireductor sp.]|uniref:DUF1295 domain-containing protein n=1 Tax=uncultured Nitratireductor sp. TaxID=520953 RepID=UPI0025F6828B|nr:DUF1295 domain-containing protein [uncultured Nitratireductor sp.]